MFLALSLSDTPNPSKLGEPYANNLDSYLSSLEHTSVFLLRPSWLRGSLSSVGTQSSRTEAGPNSSSCHSRLLAKWLLIIPESLSLPSSLSQHRLPLFLILLSQGSPFLLHPAAPCPHPSLLHWGPCSDTSSSGGRGCSVLMPLDLTRVLSASPWGLVHLDLHLQPSGPTNSRKQPNSALKFLSCHRASG